MNPVKMRLLIILSICLLTSASLSCQQLFKESKMTKIYDISIPTEDNPSEPFPVKVTHDAHDDSLPIFKDVFGADKDDIVDGTGWASDSLYLSTHAGTHADAPWHYAKTSEGKKARTIDQMPLDWFYHDGVVLDMRHKPQGSGISIDDLKEALKKINYTLKPWDIVLIQTGSDQYWGKNFYPLCGCGMTPESTLWLINQGCRVMGTDAWGWDRPFNVLKEEFAKTHDKNLVWGAHKAGIQKEYCHIEKLANLDKLPKPYGFKVACFPIKITGGSGAWARVVAIFEE
jgi:kynurenine formamidase